jgi:hypothetical protein
MQGTLVLCIQQNSHFEQPIHIHNFIGHLKVVQHTGQYFVVSNELQGF